MTWQSEWRNNDARMRLESADHQYGSLPREQSAIAVAYDEIGLQYLPNNLTRMIYLASLRDCNSGVYLHPELTKRLGIQAASALLGDIHNEIFRRLLESHLSDYVCQLQDYIRYSKTDSHTMLHNWQSLQAYRATVPLQTEKIWSEIFFLNIETGIAVLQKNRLAPAC